MSNPSKLSRLFTKAPRQWNLRGDPWLWQDLKQNIETTKPPANADAFVAWLESEFEHLVGVPLSHPDIVFLKKYNHGGMSSGCINPKFWRDTVLPFLRKSFEDQNP
jgi:hypothetical protein